MEKFQNLTLLESNSTKELKCVETCYDITVQNLTSSNLILLLGAASSLTAVSKPLLTSLNQNYNNDTIDFYNNYNNTDILINANNTIMYNFTDDDVTEYSNTLEEDLMEAKNSFQDYLSYLLSSFLSGSISENTTEYNELESTTYSDAITNKFVVSTSTPEQIKNVTDIITNYTSMSFNESSTSISFFNESRRICNQTCTIEAISYSICNTTMSETKSYASQSCLRTLCWETMFGQEIVKLTVMDLVYTIGSTLMMDFFRGLFVRVMNNCWCWDLEKKFPNYGDFKVAENILHLVNNQGMVWMGMFFSPGLVVINVFKLYIILYLRSWAVLTCNVPHEIIFRASRSNNFYFALLLMMLFLCVLPVGFAIVWQKPSVHCGPFSDYKLIFHIFTKTLRNGLPKYFHGILDYIASPGIVIPLLVLLILIIYYLVSLTNSLREANSDLKVSRQLLLKMFCSFVDLCRYN